MCGAEARLRDGLSPTRDARRAGVVHRVTRASCRALPCDRCWTLARAQLDCCAERHQPHSLLTARSLCRALPALTNHVQVRRRAPAPRLARARAAQWPQTRRPAARRRAACGVSPRTGLARATTRCAGGAHLTGAAAARATHDARAGCSALPPPLTPLLSLHGRAARDHTHPRARATEPGAVPAQAVLQVQEAQAAGHGGCRCCRRAGRRRRGSTGGGRNGRGRWCCRRRLLHGHGRQGLQCVCVRAGRLPACLGACGGCSTRAGTPRAGCAPSTCVLPRLPPHRCRAVLAGKEKGCVWCEGSFGPAPGSCLSKVGRRLTPAARRPCACDRCGPLVGSVCVCVREHVFVRQHPPRAVWCPLLLSTPCCRAHRCCCCWPVVAPGPDQVHAVPVLQVQEAQARGRSRG